MVKPKKSCAGNDLLLDFWLQIDIGTDLLHHGFSPFPDLI